jgi:hypothetical protein
MPPPLRRLLLVASLFAAGTLPAQTPRSLRVLFLGNSLTDGNDVPSLVQAMAQLHDIDLQYTAHAPGGYAIEDHWRDGRQGLLTPGRFDVLILQQGPSTLPESQANLREWAVIWANAARQAGTRPALYMIWPVRTQTGGFSLVSQSYRNAAEAAGAAIFPAGEAWRDAVAASPGLSLYQSDDLHAQPAGSFLAAMAIGRGLFGLDPARVPARVRHVTVTDSALATFRAVIAAQPAVTLGALDVPVVSTPPATPPPAPAPATTPPAQAAGNGGGGGAPSLWFLAALAALAYARRRS